VTDIDRRSVFFERKLDNADRAINAGAKAARCRYEEMKRRFFSHISGSLYAIACSGESAFLYDG
jgi:hypothetical protein